MAAHAHDTIPQVTPLDLLGAAVMEAAP